MNLRGSYWLYSRIVVVTTVLSVALTTCAAQDKPETTAKTAETPMYRAGAASVHIPAPTNDLVEMGSDYRVLMDSFVPASNRLVAAFVLPETLAGLKMGTKREPGKYALVEVARRVEFVDLDEDGFKTVVDASNKQMGGDDVDKIAKNTVEEIDRKIAASGMGSGKVALDKVVQLGSFFSKHDAYGFGMMMPMSQDGKTVNMVCGAAILRANRRLLLGYVYAEYKDEDTVKQVIKATEEWADAILKANPE